MAPLPKGIEIMAPRLRDMMSKGPEGRDKAKKLVLKLLNEGSASPEVQKIAAELFSAKKGRPPAGVKHRWMDVGQENEDLIRTTTLTENERLEKLSEKFALKGLDFAYIKGLIAQYNRYLESLPDPEWEPADRPSPKRT